MSSKVLVAMAMATKGGWSQCIIHNLMLYYIIAAALEDPSGSDHQVVQNYEDLVRNYVVRYMYTVVIHEGLLNKLWLVPHLLQLSSMSHNLCTYSRVVWTALIPYA